MTVWQWFGIALALCVFAALYIRSEPLGKSIMQIIALMLCGCAAIFGIIALIMGSWVPW